MQPNDGEHPTSVAWTDQQGADWRYALACGRTLQILPLRVCALMELDDLDAVTGRARTNQGRVAEKLGVTSSHISQALADAVKRGYLTLIREGDRVVYQPALPAREEP